MFDVLRFFDMVEEMLKRTALFDVHVQAGGRIVEFGGWEMPVQYAGIRPEHLAVRNSAGLFDISHMGQLLVSGPLAATFLNQALTNDISQLRDGLGQYSLLCHDSNGGGTIDDLYVFQLNPQKYLLILNASRYENDKSFLTQLMQSMGFSAGVQFSDLSLTQSALALQGPLAEHILREQFSSLQSSVASITKNEIRTITPNELPHSDLLISRTGYTGEDGFELMAEHSVIVQLWGALLQKFLNHGLVPAGLGARDTLRLEAGYPLYGHELDEQTLPNEAGLNWAVARHKPQFSGKQSILLKSQDPEKRQLIGLQIAEKSPPPRMGYSLFAQPNDSLPCGHVTSGTLSPSLNAGIGLAYVPQVHSQLGRTWWIDIRGKKYPCQQTRRSFLVKAN